MSGARVFVRFAHPPNALGYCGPVTTGAPDTTDDEKLRTYAHEFAGAWPYLELIANANGVDDPLDERVVRAYWIGNELLDAVDHDRLRSSLERRFRPTAGDDWPRIAATIAVSHRAHHGLHVFGLYPWVGLLSGRAGPRAVEVLDGCRIRTGRVRSVDGDTATVECAHLEWDGRELRIGDVRTESVALSVGTAVAPGDLVACHWGWACDQVSDAEAATLASDTEGMLVAVNRWLAD